MPGPPRGPVAHQAQPSALMPCSFQVVRSWSVVSFRPIRRRSCRAPSGSCGRGRLAGSGPSVGAHWLSFLIAAVCGRWSQAHPSALIRVLLSARGSAGGAGCYRFRPIRRRSLAWSSSPVRLGAGLFASGPSVGVHHEVLLSLVTVWPPGRLTRAPALLTSAFSRTGRSQDASTGPVYGCARQSFRPRVCESTVN